LYLVGKRYFGKARHVLLDTARTKIQASSPFAELRELLDKNTFPELVGTSGLGTALIVDFLVRELHRPVLWVVSEDSYTHWRDIATLLGEERALYLPEWDIEPYEHRLPDEEIVATRLDTFTKLRTGETVAAVASAKALLFPTISPAALDENSITISVGDEIPPERLLARLIDIGYNREELVEFLGAVSRRGDILDSFCATHRDPVRIEFFGDEVESIRTFSAENQRSIEDIKRVIIPPANEWLKNFWKMREIELDNLRDQMLPGFRGRFDSQDEDELLSRILFDQHFPGEIWFSPAFSPAPCWPDAHLPENAIIVCEEPEEIYSVADDLLSRAEDHHFELSHDSELHLPPQELFIDSERFSERIRRHKLLPIRHFQTTENALDMGFRPILAGFGGAVAFRRTLERLKSEEFHPQILCQNRYQIERLGELLPPEESVAADVAEISCEFSHIPSKETIITGTTIFGGRRRTKPRRRYREGNISILPTGLNIGDYVVHTDHGIGMFLGAETVESKGFTSECLVLEYADDEKLNVPVEDFHLVQKYIGGEHTRLAKLGGVAWTRTKERARKGIIALAGELVQLYALREVADGHAFPPEDELSQALAESFPYAETSDQLRTIEEVLDDMEQPRPMDRLIVGDVGFGKTEVAIRAAFKAVRGGKQVAVLVPTTVLADQHFRTFTERLFNLPVRVEMLSRFRSPKEQRQIVGNIANGKVDIVIGTHRLLSKDVHFKDLGLLIVDEEQRFGVKHKERIKRWRAKIDVLTMSATPIPRTLYMSLAGVRDMSTIDTPPANRLPIYTRVVPLSNETIAEAIMREISRGGQVYFLHNRVGSIDAIARWLMDLVPDARFTIAHGQMPEKQLSKIILEFLAGNFDVLVTTTIIESGTDITNVNTIIINRADKFGVSQLYQLRGRVGRSDVQAYCYLVAPPYRKITTKAKKRLKALLEHSDLGSGFALAMRDMEIRGTGNLLGAQQHGFIEEVGLDLYSKMLSEAVAELKGQKPPHFVPVNTQVDAPLFIPKEYIPSTKMRIEFYQRLYMAPDENRISRIKAEMQDRFGTLPEEVSTLITYLRMRLAASKVNLPLSEVILKKGRATFLFAREWQPRLADIDRALSPLELAADFRRDPFELRFELSGKPDDDLLLMRNIAERLGKMG